MRCPRCRTTMTEGNAGSKCQKCGYINKPRGKMVYGSMDKNYWMTGK